MTGLAQLVERLTAEQEVMGSIPRAGLVLRVLTNGEMKVLPFALQMSRPSHGLDDHVGDLK